MSPKVIPFKPYESAELAAIVQQRLQSFSPVLLESKAIDLIAAKVATDYKGDARKVLQLCMYVAVVCFIFIFVFCFVLVNVLTSELSQRLSV